VGLVVPVVCNADEIIEHGLRAPPSGVVWIPFHALNKHNIISTHGSST
jgi:hypothetical protein